MLVKDTIIRASLSHNSTRSVYVFRRFITLLNFLIVHLLSFIILHSTFILVLMGDFRNLFASTDANTMSWRTITTFVWDPLVATSFIIIIGALPRGGHLCRAEPHDHSFSVLDPSNWCEITIFTVRLVSGSIRSYNLLPLMSSLWCCFDVFYFIIFYNIYLTSRACNQLSSQSSQCPIISYDLEPELRFL